MKKKRLFLQIFIPTLTIAILSILAEGVYSLRKFRDSHYALVENELRKAAYLVVKQINSHNEPLDSRQTDILCKSLSKTSGYRITVILSSGKVIGDSDKDPSIMDNHENRPEIMKALNGAIATNRRYSQTLKMKMLYVAAPLSFKGKSQGAIRLSLSLAAIDKTIHSMWMRLAVVGILVAILAAILTYFVTGRITQPLQEISAGAKAFGRGALENNLPRSNIKEIDVLADTLNQMAVQLHKMDKMRKDFVANVSHELKTPITSILGFADTLRSGDVESKEDLNRFLAIIDKQAGRLQSIVEDLLALSSIEDGTEKGAVELHSTSLDSVIQSAVQSCQNKARKHNKEIQVKCDESIQALVNPLFLEQAIANLIDNAIKYTEDGRNIEINARSYNDKAVISVKDDGPGIPAKNQPRLFERFYRVDKSRSRKLGGTGLGLAIVKHIAIAHGGRVEVESNPGKGSTFSIILRKN